VREGIEMSKLVDWSKLPDDLMSEIFRHYCDLEFGILVELKLAGIEVVGHDYGDEDWDRYFWFESVDDMDAFTELVYESCLPSSNDWRIWDYQQWNIAKSAEGREDLIEESEGCSDFEVAISRQDLHRVLTLLESYNDANGVIEQDDVNHVANEVQSDWIRNVWGN
jgi:hypothetical protein